MSAKTATMSAKMTMSVRMMNGNESLRQSGSESEISIETENVNWSAIASATSENAISNVSERPTSARRACAPALAPAARAADANAAAAAADAADAGVRAGTQSQCRRREWPASRAVRADTSWVTDCRRRRQPRPWHRRRREVGQTRRGHHFLPWKTTKTTKTTRRQRTRWAAESGDESTTTTTTTRTTPILGSARRGPQRRPRQQ
jgi:hypothetical protein